MNEMNKNIKPTKLSENSAFKKYNYMLEEIVLMALTYRLSVKDLQNMFNTTEDDVYALFNYVEKYTKACEHLDLETRVIPNEESRFLRAQKYLERSINLHEALEERIKEKADEKVIKALKILLRKHQMQVDATIFNRSLTKKKKELTDEEKEAIARFRTKYNITLYEIKNIMKMNADRFVEFEQLLAKVDSHFALQLDFLNNKNAFNKSCYIKNDFDSMKR